MSFIKQYRLSLSAAFLIAAFVISLVWINVPIEGLASPENEDPSFPFGYLYQSSFDLDMFQAREKELTYMAAPESVIQRRGADAFSFYPVNDVTSSVESSQADYPIIPDEMLPGYGKTVYFIDYGVIRFIFLNGSRMDSPKEQMEWLKHSVANSHQNHHIVFVNELPRNVEIWKTIRSLGVRAVIVGNKIYIPEETVSSIPPGFTSMVQEGWGVWNIASMLKEPHLLAIHGKDQWLYLKAMNKLGNVLQAVEVDSSRTLLKKELDRGVLVGIQSFWRYHAGGVDVKMVIPEGFDVSGETPIIEEFHLPPEDWRSPEYNDSKWEIGQGMLGVTRNAYYERQLHTHLHRSSESPTFYFRHIFVLNEDSNQFKRLLLHIAFEDGFAAYLNGEEIARDALKTGLLTHSTLAVPNEFTPYKTIDITKHQNKLKPGNNVIAVEIHRSHPKAPNLFFDLNMSYQK